MSKDKELKAIKARLKAKRVRGNLDDIAARLLKLKNRGKRSPLLDTTLYRTPLLYEGLGDR